MPVLKNPRHERFAVLLASGKTATDAYELAGYRRSDSNGPNLARTNEISGRVAEINGETLERERKTAAVAAERCVVTRQSLIEKAEAIYVQAREAGQTSAAIAALKEIGVLTGIRVERRESGDAGEFAKLEAMSADELRSFLTAALEGDEVIEVDGDGGSVH